MKKSLRKNYFIDTWVMVKWNKDKEMMTKETREHIQYLLLRYLDGKASYAEREELGQLLAEKKDTEDDGIWEELMTELLQTEPALRNYEEAAWQPMIERLIAKNKEAALPFIKPVRRIQFSQKTWWAAAAIFILLVGAGAYYWINRPVNSNIANTRNKGQELKNDVSPGRTGAILTLANGQKILLDTARNGDLVIQGSTTLINQDGRVIYNKEGGGGTNELLFNILSTPRGRQYQVALSDGSRVWLNAASSIRYPTAFGNDERKVAITGEAYFEVAHDAKKPFKVEVNGMIVEVLGTHFNINSYDNEATLKTSLLQGSVKLIKGNVSKILAPGKQGELNKKGDLSVTAKVNMEEVVAWKEGLFVMKNADISSMLRQIARWYDVEIEYSAGVPAGKITGDIPRTMNLSKVLEVMELSGLHFRIEGKKVIVLP